MRPVDSDIHSRLQVARLPAMPQILLKLIEQCQAEDAGMSALAELIAKDPGITCKVLAVANSSAYHRAGRKIGLEQSLSVLGADMIKTLIINESVFQVFNGFTHSNATDLRSFWKHSLSAAVMAQEIAEEMHYPNVEEAYLAGLLHDVGRLALLATATKEYAFVFFARDDEKLCAVERGMLNMTHTEAGAWLVDRWNMDSFLSDSVLYHHEPVDRVQNAHPLVHIVLLSHLLSIHDANELSVKAAGALCGIEISDLERISETSKTKVQKFADLLGIDLSGADDLIVPTDGWEIAGLLAEMDEANASAASSSQVSGEPKAHERAQKLLAEEVHNVVLSSELSRSFSRQQDGEAALIETIARSARLLFDFKDVAILRMDTAGNTLVGVPVGGQQERLKEFTIALGQGGLIASAARQRQVVFLANALDQQSITENHLLRLLGSESLVCVPIASAQRCLGVLIGGIATCQAQGLQNRERFLRSFGEQAVSFIHALAGKSAAASAQAASAAEEYKDASRRVIHEANNALSIIKNYLGVLDGKLEKQELVVSERAILHEEVDRVGQIIKGLTEQAPASADSVTEVNRSVRDVVRLFQETAALKIVAHTSESASEVKMSAASLKQILVNLVKNAVEAMPHGGEIQVRNNGHVNLDGILYTELCVRDNGPGIPQNILELLFSPMPSSKGGGHQGLGLSIVHGLIKQSQGLITCRSGTRGTAFDILLPIHKRS